MSVCLSVRPPVRPPAHLAVPLYPCTSHCPLRCVSAGLRPWVRLPACLSQPPSPFRCVSASRPASVRQSVHTPVTPTLRSPLRCVTAGWPTSACLPARLSVPLYPYHPSLPPQVCDGRLAYIRLPARPPVRTPVPLSPLAAPSGV